MSDPALVSWKASAPHRLLSDRAAPTGPAITVAARTRLDGLAEEQAALRRLAMAVANGAAPSEIFRAVAEEAAPLLGVDDAAVVRFERDHTAVILAEAGAWTEQVDPVPVSLDDALVIAEVFQTGRSARVDDRDSSSATGPGSASLRREGCRSAVASPIVVEGHLWGAMVASSHLEPLAEDIEQRMADFTQLVGVVIANAESRAELIASRARVVAAAAAARRRIQRDLHDGAQQRMMNTVIVLKLARDALGDTHGPAAQLVEEALAHAEAANGELRELAHGILPSVLSQGGLRAGIAALASRVPWPVSLHVTPERFPAALEAGAYFIIAEALTNAVKHARASGARVTAVIDRGSLRLEVVDDGIGGATTSGGSGLLGLSDRAAALSGQLRVTSPPGHGTVIAALLPIPERHGPQRRHSTLELDEALVRAEERDYREHPAMIVLGFREP